MPIDRINFSTSLECANPHSGLRSWKKFGARYTIEEGESKEDARTKLKDFVYESLKKQPEEIPEKVVAKEQVLDTPQTTEAKIIAQIYGCSDLTVLSSFKLLSNKYPAVKAAYDQQFEKLSKSS